MSQKNERSIKVPEGRDADFRRQDFKDDDDGAYVIVYQRCDELEPSVELAFFEGDRSIEEAELRFRLLQNALALAQVWKHDDWAKKK